MNLTNLFKDFFESEKSGGILLIACTTISLIVSNSVGGSYVHFWHMDIGGHSVEYWINDGLMTIFFLLIGLELEREIYAGELKRIKHAALPVFAAAGGMAVPAGIFVLFNYGSPALSGAGIPTATDIAFAIGIMSLLGNRVPSALKVFLTAFAIIDDLGAIIIIAIFYSSDLNMQNLGIALSIFGFLLVLNRLKVHSLFPYLAAGAVMWYFMLQSGVHATISGVLLAFAIPFGSGRENSPSYILQKKLHKPVAWFILPLFAMANTALILEPGWTASLGSAISIGIIAGLLAGKPIGILLFSFISVKSGLTYLPHGVRWNHIAGAGLLGGIGFTMSIFIALLAYSDAALIAQSKVAVLTASLLAGLAGYIFLSRTLSKTNKS